MIFRYGLLAAACILMVLAAGCTGTPAQSGTAPQPGTTAQTLVPPVSPAAPAVSPSGTPGSCSGDVCSVIPPSASVSRSLRIDPSPRNYSPLMSSTPGIGLEPVATGFNATDAAFTWNASYGQFLLSSESTGYTISTLGTSATGPGKKLYWSFTDKPANTSAPVIITVTAQDPVTGESWGSSVVTLVWTGDYAVTVQQAG